MYGKFLMPVLALALAATPVLADGNKGKKHKNGYHSAQSFCPPGLAKKNPPCVPPRHAKLRSPGDFRPGDRLPVGWHRLSDPWRYGLHRKGGTGLGLAIAAELVRGHGGRLELLKTGAEGTEFIIRLPRDLTAPPLATPPATAPARSPESPLRPPETPA